MGGLGAAEDNHQRNAGGPNTGYRKVNTKKSRKAIREDDSVYFNDDEEDED